MLLIWFLSPAQIKTLNLGKASTKNYLSVVKFEKLRDKLIVPVTIEGRQYRFLFDTGAPNIISQELDSILNLKQIGSIPTSDATGKRDILKVVSVASLFFGEVEFVDTPTLVYELNESAVFTCFDVDGFIGSNMLRNSIVQIDGQSQTITLTDKRKNLALDKENSTKIFLTKNQSNPYIWVELKGEKKGREQLLIDTGAGDLYDLSKNYYDFFKDKKIFKQLGTAKGASSISLFGDAPVSTQYKLLLPVLVVNNKELHHVITETTDDDNSRVGAKLLDYGKMTINYKNKRFYFEPYEQIQENTYYDYGFSSTLIGDKLCIGLVWDEALKEDLFYGDEIISLNGMSVTNVVLCDLLTSEDTPRNRPVMNITVREPSGRIKKFELKGTEVNVQMKD
jgi:hypothetical protein